MSSNPLMMGFVGGDLCWLALPGRSGRCPGLCAQAVGGGLGGRAAPVSDVTAHY